MEIPLFWSVNLNGDKNTGFKWICAFWRCCLIIIVLQIIFWLFLKRKKKAPVDVLKKDVPFCLFKTNRLKCQDTVFSVEGLYINIKEQLNIAAKLDMVYKNKLSQLQKPKLEQLNATVLQKRRKNTWNFPRSTIYELQVPKRWSYALLKNIYHELLSRLSNKNYLLHDVF